ncbi:MAG TPA: hypothetical protein PLT09_03315 [Deltaproteobacteria bacterium]|nr:hypothetical protein [Deltaproteobacteria bacterium]HPR56184.1 hypothetical protein [Deltaproteobacteria bacterium]HXK46441.1 hypothetical protein [Deltaproteobacteria bacterium]
MARDEFLMQLQKARKAVEEYKSERLSEAHSLSEHRGMHHAQNESNQPVDEAKPSEGSGTVCPYCKRGW